MTKEIIKTVPIWVDIPHEKTIQENPDIVKEFDKTPYYITTKYDGEPRYIAIDEEGQTYFSQDEKFIEWLKQSNVLEKLKQFKEMAEADKVYVFGEFCGPEIHDNPLELKELKWFPFTAKVDEKLCDYEALHLLSGVLGMQPVQTEEMGFYLNMSYPTMADLVTRATKAGIYVYPPEKPGEGIIVRGLYKPELSFQVFNPNYLLTK